MNDFILILSIYVLGPHFVFFRNFFVSYNAFWVSTGSTYGTFRSLKVALTAHSVVYR